MVLFLLEYKKDSRLCLFQSLPAIYQTTRDEVLQHSSRVSEIMLTTEAKECKNISQEYYDYLVDNLQIHRIQCPSCHHFGNMVIHGYYQRWAKSFRKTFRLRIQRLKCNECGKTHAILPSSLVPYNQISTDSQIQIAQAVETGISPQTLIETESDIDENNVKYVVRKYRRHWKERLRAEGIDFGDMRFFIRLCFFIFYRQFMQIRRVFNPLILDTT